MKASDAGILSPKVLFLYALPAAGMTAMHWLIMVFLLKYSTDVLGIAPAAMGAILAGSRMWDAFSDPIAGWASDRTRTRMGRRRPWMAAAALPGALAFYALWSAPGGEGPLLSAVWIGASLFFFFTASTASRIPYLALGAELTRNHHERTRLSAIRVGAEIVGIFAALAGLHWMENAASTREVAMTVAALIGTACAASLILAAWLLPEPRENMGRGASHPLRAFADVFRNPHARRLTAALLLAELGLGSLLVAVPYVTEMMGRPGTSAITMLGFIVPFAISVPLWIPLGRRFGKARCFAAASGLCALAFILLGTGAYDSEYAWIGCMALIGFSQAALRTFPESIKADVIDWDEAQTGERKEGTYFAAWNLADKAAGALSVGLVGLVIQGSDGGVSMEGVRFATSLMPAGFLLLSTASLFGFRLNAAAHARLTRDIYASTSPIAKAGAETFPPVRVDRSALSSNPLT